MARLGFSHDPSTAQPAEFAEAYRDRLGWPPETLGDRDLADSMALLLSSIHGVSPHELTELRITTGCPNEDTTVALDLETGVVWRRLPRIAHDAAPGVTPRSCRPGSPWASIPSSTLVRSVMHAYRARVPGLRAGARVFPPPTEMLGDTRLLARLARSVDRWLRRCGLPSVVAATISGRFDVTTLSTSAYANLSEAQVGRAHADACAQFFALVREEATHRGWDLPALTDSGLLHASAGAGRRFGSHYVPEPAAVATAIRALEGKLRRVDAHMPLHKLAPAFNLFATYEWLRLGWATALRPRRDPVVTASRLDAEGAWLVVEDKHSPFSLEARPVPLLQSEAARLVRLRDLGVRVRARLRFAGVDLTAVPDDTLFFCIADRRAVPLGRSTAPQVLAEAGLAAHFPWVPNAPRHFWISRALELGLNLREVGAFLGHAHEPTAWGPYSLTSLAASATTFRRLAETILREVGFRDVRANRRSGSTSLDCQARGDRAATPAWPTRGRPSGPPSGAVQ
jgi:hypothetical protein